MDYFNKIQDKTNAALRRVEAAGKTRAAEEEKKRLANIKLARTLAASKVKELRSLIESRAEKGLSYCKAPTPRLGFFVEPCYYSNIIHDSLRKEGFHTSEDYDLITIMWDKRYSQPSCDEEYKLRRKAELNNSCHCGGCVMCKPTLHDN